MPMRAAGTRAETRREPQAEEKRRAARVISSNGKERREAERERRALAGGEIVLRRRGGSAAEGKRRRKRELVAGRPMFIGCKRIAPHKTFSRIFVFFAETLYQKGFDACGGSLFS
jgi:hypothetical protein